MILGYTKLTLKVKHQSGQLVGNARIGNQTLWGSWKPAAVLIGSEVPRGDWCEALNGGAQKILLDIDHV